MLSLGQYQYQAAKTELEEDGSGGREVQERETRKRRFRLRAPPAIDDRDNHFTTRQHRQVYIAVTYYCHNLTISCRAEPLAEITYPSLRAVTPLFSAQ